MAQRHSCSWIRRLTPAFLVLLPIVGVAMAQGTATAYRYSGRIAFDIGDVPFSRYGSYLAFSKLSGTNAPDAATGIYLRNMHGSSEAEHPAFRVELLAGGSPLAFETTASPGRLHLSATAGSVDICLSGTNRVLFHGQGVSLRFVPVGEAVVVPNRNNHWEIHGTSQYREKYMLWAVAGGLRVSEVWTGKVSQNVFASYIPDPKSHMFEGEIDTYDSVWTSPAGGGDFAATLESVKTDYAHWLQRMPTVPSEFGPGAELAAYVNWTSVVAPMGFLGRPAMLMSKNWMANVWSWDQCFNAMALSLSDPELAWQQMEIPFDNQESHGALPDHIRDSSRTFTYTKPPIHGWALLWMMKRGGYKDAKHLGELYGPLSRWTEWYFRYRDSNDDGLPEYDHGNDSGWDNSTVMLSGIPIESPDLDSYLILQMDALSTLAEMLGRNQEAKLWHSRSESLLRKMIATLWRDDHFVALRADNGQELESESLLLYMPLVLGKRLPIAVQEKLVEGLTRRGRFRTSYGFSSEALTSEYYTSDGYWRGPIWAPTSMLLAEGLDSIEDHRIAHDLRVDFCKMVQRSGMFENFDAKTGIGLRDPAYTWTSSVYLIFAHQLWEENQKASSPAKVASRASSRQ